MSEPRWIDRRALLLLHAEGLREHGGPEGVRDAGLLESALDRPRNLAAHEPESDLPRLAACYAVGIARNHPFVDGNKRTALATCLVFLSENGLLPEESLDVDEWESLTLDAAGGKLSRDGVSARLRRLVK